MLDGPPKVQVRFQPKAAFLKKPVLDAASNDLVFAVGMEFQTLALLDASAPTTVPESAIGPVPPLTVSSDVPQMSNVILPVDAKLSDVSVLIKDQVLPWEDGSISVHRVETADSDGVLHVRVHFDTKLPSSASALPFKQFKGALMVRVKPACDKASGAILVEDFGFSSHTNLMLVDLFGPTLTESFKDALKGMVSHAVADALRNMEQQIETQVNQLLDQQRINWASQMPQLAKLAGATKAKVEGLRLKPLIFEIRAGYLVAAIQVQGTATVMVEIRHPASSRWNGR